MYKTKLPKTCQYCQEAVEKWSSQKYFEPKTENYKNSTENKLYKFYRKEKVLPTTTTTTTTTTTRDVSKCKTVTSHDSVHTAVH